MEILAACSIACYSFRRTPAFWSASWSACPRCAALHGCMTDIGSDVHA